MIANPCFHCWRNAQGLMYSAEVVIHVMERDRVLQVFQLFAKRISQSRESAHRHSHRQILTLGVAGRNVVVVWVAADNGFASAHANAGTVSSFQCSRRIAEDFVQHCVVDLGSEGLVNCNQVGFVSISRQLNAIGETLLHIAQKVIARCRVSRPDEPARDKFCVSIERNPSPNIATAFDLLLQRAIFLLRINKRPNLIALDSAALEIAKRFVLIFRASAAKIAEKFDDRVFGNARHSDSSADAVSLDQARNDRRLFFSAQFIHALIMLERSSIVNSYFWRR
jgi:hypothetical protein